MRFKLNKFVDVSGVGHYIVGLGPLQGVSHCLEWRGRGVEGRTGALQRPAKQTDRRDDMTENITFTQLRWQAVNIMLPYRKETPTNVLCTVGPACCKFG